MALTLLITIVMFAQSWPRIVAWDLGDNDNYMRLHQIQTFIESPSWYLHPLKDFNPQDGQIIHWSRLPDLPILLVYYIANAFVDHDTALQIAISIVPLVYLVLLVLVMNIFIKKTFGQEYIILSTIYTIFSIAATKFKPGYIDHHNIQLLLFAFFLLLIYYYREKYSLICGLCVATSLAIGLESLPFYILVLAITVLKELNSKEKTSLTGSISIYIFLSGTILLVILNPIKDLVSQKYDVISLELLSYFLFTGIGLKVASNSDKKNTKLVILIISSLIPLLLFPKAIIPPYVGYPEILNEFWLDNVSEAKSFIKFTTETTLTSILFYGSVFISFILSLLFFKKLRKIDTIVISLAISVLSVIFWQIRTIVFSSILLIPLVTLSGMEVFRTIKIPVLRILAPLMLVPAIIAMPTILTDNQLNIKTQTINKRNEEKTSLPKKLKELNITNKNILTSIDYGAIIISRTNNKIYSAPYHRNINGNLFLIETMQSDISKETYTEIKKHNVEIILIDINDEQTKIISRTSSDLSLINNLIKGTNPKWTKKIYSDDNGISIYSIN